MQRIKLLDEMIELQERQVEGRGKALLALEKRRREDYGVVWNEYLKDFPFHNTTIKVGDSRVEICRDREDYPSKELMTIYMRDRWGEEGFTSLETSVYSSSDNSDFELERLVTVGAVAQVLLDHHDNILAELNSIRSVWRDKVKEATKALGDARSALRSLEQDKNNVYLDHGRELLMGEGLTFHDKLGSFDYRFDHEVRAVRTAKVTEVSASGKTCTVEITQYFSYYDEERTQTLTRVKMSNLDSLLWQYRDYVLLAEEKDELEVAS